jgi:hypothetical protein
LKILDTKTIFSQHRTGGIVFSRYYIAGSYCPLMVKKIQCVWLPNEEEEMSDSFQLADVVVANGATGWSEPFAAFKHDAAWVAQVATSAAAMTLTVTLEMSYTAKGPWFAADLAETSLGGGLDLAAAASPDTTFSAISDLGGSPFLRFKIDNGGASPAIVSLNVGLGSPKDERVLGLPSSGAQLFSRLRGHEKDVAVPLTVAVETEAVHLSGYKNVALFHEGAAGPIVAGTVHLLLAADRDGPYEEQASSGAGDSDLAADFLLTPGQNYAKVRVKGATTAGTAKISLFGR